MDCLGNEMFNEIFRELERPRWGQRNHLSTEGIKTRLMISVGSFITGVRGGLSRK